MDITSFLDPGGVVLSCDACSKKQVLQAIAHKAAELTGLNERAIFLALIERERLGSTAVGKGGALPHARVPGLERTVSLFVRLERPVDFEAADGQKVDLFFILLAPTSTALEPLRTIAHLLRLLHDGAACTRIREASTVNAVYTLLTTEAERLQPS